MTKFIGRAWEWLLAVNSQLLMLFHLFVWMPVIVIFWMPVIEAPPISMTKTMAINVIYTYVLFLPLLFELVRDHIKAKRTTKS